MEGIGIYDKKHDGNCSVNPHRCDDLAKSDEGFGFDIESVEFRKHEMRFKARVYSCLRMNAHKLKQFLFSMMKSDQGFEVDFGDILASYLIWVRDVSSMSRKSAEKVLKDAFGYEAPKNLLDMIEANDNAAFIAHANEMVEKAKRFTEDRVSAIASRIVEEKLSDDEIEELVDSDYAFSQTRASTIAATELFIVANAAADSLYSFSRVAYRKWNVYPGCCKTCSDNASVGWIEFGRSFPSGNVRPPAHPNCRCDVKVRSIPSIGGSASVLMALNSQEE